MNTRVAALIMLGMLLMALPAFAQDSQKEVEANIKSLCAAEWPTDFKMRAYCQDQQWKGVQELAGMAEHRGGMPEDAFLIAFTKCLGEWDTNYEMLVYCMKQQIDGYHRSEGAGAMVGSGATTGEQQTISEHCKREWPTDYEMQAYCEKQQAEGLRFLKQKPGSIAEEQWQRLLRHCSTKWTDDFSMQAYCVRQELGY